MAKKKKDVGGRPTSLTPETQRVVIAALEAGNYIDTACKIAGITRQTYFNWLKRGQVGEEPFKGFFDTCEKTIAEAESAGVKNIREAGKRNWQAWAWWLERRHRNRWAKTSDLSSTTPASSSEPPTVTERPPTESK